MRFLLMTIKIITGNGGHSNTSRGASGSGYLEHAVARNFNELFLKKAKAMGYQTVDSTSNAQTSSSVLVEQVKKANSVSKVGRLDVSFHLNSNAGTPATGVEVLYYSNKELAAKVSKAISLAVGLRDRGAKERKDLYFLKNTNGSEGAILIELGFINNPDDMKKLMNNKEKVIDAIIKAITGKEVKHDAVTVQKKLYKVFVGNVQKGAFSSVDNAMEEAKKQLKTSNEVSIKFI